MRNFSLVTLFFFHAVAAFSQSLITGRVVDAATKNPIGGASVWVESTELQTTTNYLGYFQVEADSNSLLVIKSSGYETGSIDLPPGDSFQFELIKSAKPDYKGGINAFYQYIAQNLRYPANARARGTQGRLYVLFRLDSLGNISDLETLNDIGDGCSEEVIQLIRRTSGSWIPHSAHATVILPVTFLLGETTAKPVGTDIDLPGGSLFEEIVVRAVAAKSGKTKMKSRH